ncbi:MAG TPA: YncE family protein [Bryobacteraceae bacterium]|nr:YncE family protein [Bryobacteraceae bacterium]
MTPRITRRALLAASAASIGCGPQKATGFPGYCFVANRGGRSVTAVDLNTFRASKHIPLDAAPAAMAAGAVGGKPKVYALAPAEGRIYEIDVASLSVSRRAWGGNQAAGMQLSAKDDALWVLYREPAALVQFPLGSFRPARRIALASAPDSFDLSADGRAAVVSRKARSIALVSLDHGAVERAIPCADEPALVQFRADGEVIIAGFPNSRSLGIYDVATGKTVVRLPLPVAPRHFGVSPDGGQLFVTGDGMDAVVIVFPYTTEVEQTILAGHAPGAVAVTQNATSYLLVANPDTNSVTALDMYSRRLVAVVQVGQSPCDIVLTPDNQYALSVDEASGDLAVIRLSTFSEAWVHHYKSASLFTMVPVGEGPTSAVVVGYRG